MHIVGTLETAYAFGLKIRPKVGDDPTLKTAATFDPYQKDDFDQIVDTWLPLTFAINSLNRSMGHPDLYPFVLNPVALNKMRFVHEVIRGLKRG
jgi:hypothetical protein